MEAIQNRQGDSQMGFELGRRSWPAYEMYIRIVNMEGHMKTGFRSLKRSIHSQRNFECYRLTAPGSRPNP